VAVLRLPRPYDFLLSTERFRAFGPDLANLWDGEALLRAVDGREVRIAAAPGGVDAEPLDAESEPVVRKLLGAELDLRGFARFAAGADPVLARLAKALAGFRPPLAPDPFEALVGSITAQQVSLFSAFAVRSRLIERFGGRAGRVYAFPTRERLAAAVPEELTALGFSRRKAEYTLVLARSDLDLEGLGALDDDEAGPASGRWTGSSPGTSPARAPGRPATSDCGRRSRRSTPTGASSVRTRCETSAPASSHGRT